MTLSRVEGDASSQSLPLVGPKNCYWFLVSLRSILSSLLFLLCRWVLVLPPRTPWYTNLLCIFVSPEMHGRYSVCMCVLNLSLTGNPQSTRHLLEPWMRKLNDKFQFLIHSFLNTYQILRLALWLCWGEPECVVLDNNFRTLNNLMTLDHVSSWQVLAWCRVDCLGNSLRRGVLIRGMAF